MADAPREKLIFELRRKIVHLFSFVYIFAYYYLSQIFSHRTALLFLTAILIFIAFFEFLRISLGRKIPFLQSLHRETENGRISSSIYLIIGVIIAFSVFEFEIAVTSILMMMFGDMAAALVGLSFGKHKIKIFDGVAWEGVLAEFLIDVLIGFIFLNNLPVIFIMALAATFVETALDAVDDNLSVPIVAGFAGQTAMMIMRVLGLA
jgi:dolichol kinase